MREELERKIEQSINILKVACKGKTVELAYSGGKYSDGTAHYATYKKDEYNIK